MHAFARWTLAVTLPIFALSCGGGGSPSPDGTDGAVHDIVTRDAGDAGTTDTGPPDAGPPDSGPVDAGPNVPPVAAFEATPTTGATPLDVTLDASASHDPDGAIVAWDWDFGDGAAGTGEVVAHTYEVVGTFTVTLTVTDDRGATDGASATIVVEEGLERTEFSGLVSGEVWDTDARAPLEGARVTIQGLPGVALTGADGRFRAPTPGPGTWQLNIDKEGYTYARRTASVDTAGFAGVDPIYLKVRDPAVTTIGPAGGTHVSADGEVELDIPPGATAIPLDVQVTNLDHEDELPAPLPEHTDFTYCVNLEPELAVFSAPVTVRVANSLGFPPGTQIPVGIFRRDEGQWRHETVATVSDDGAWVTYEATHFSAHDINFYQWTLGGNTQAPGAGNTNSLADSTNTPANRRCKSVKGGSDVDVRDGELSIQHDLPVWRSLERLRGVRLEYSSRAAAPTALVGVDYEFVQEEGKWTPEGHTVITRVAGDSARFRFEPMEGPHRFAWLWEPRATGRDAVPTGVYRYAVEVSNDYRVNYWRSLEFAGAVVEETGIPGRQLARRQAEFRGLLPVRNLVTSPFGAGWAVAGLQRLIRAPGGAVVIREGATGLTLFQGGLVLDAWPSEDTAGFFEGEDAYPMGLAFAPDGSLLFTASEGSHRLWRVSPDGTLTRLAGDGTEASTGDGGPAVDAQLSKPHGLAVDDAGNIFVTEMGGRVRRIDANGIITTVAGTGVSGWGGDGGPATAAKLDWPMDVAVGPEGELYIADARNGRIRRVDADGAISTFAGGGSSNADGVPAVNANLGGPTGVAVDPEGAVYIACQAGPNRVKRVDPDGTIRNLTPAIDGGVLAVEVGPDGDVYYRVAPADTWIEKVGADGIRETVVGGGTGEMVYGAAATDVEWRGGFHLAFDPLGRLTVGSSDGLVFSMVPSPSIPGRELAGGPGDFTVLAFDEEGGATRGYSDGATVHFDADGYQVAADDRLGNRTRYEWEGTGDARRLVRIVGPAGLAAEIRYDDAGHVEAIDDPAGRTTEFEVDARGDLVRIGNPDGGERHFAYDAAHRMAEREEPMGETTSYEFDGAGALRRVVLPDGAERLFDSIYGGPILNGTGGQHFWEQPQPAPVRQPKSERAVDATGETHAYETNAFGSRTSIEDPLGAVTRFERNEDNLPTTIELPDGAEIHNEYDDRGRLLRFEDPTGAVSQFAYDGPNGAVSVLTDPDGVRSEFAYDEAGNPTSLVVAAGTDEERRWETRYASTGLTEWSRDPDGDEIHYEYDDLGRCSALTDALGRTVRFTYDAAGNTTVVEDAAGEEWKLEFDAMGRVTARENPLGDRRTYEHDLSGRTTAIVDEVGARTEFDFDAMGRIVTVRDPLGQEVQLSHDGEGFIVRADRPDGIFTWHYDRAHNLVRTVRHHGDDGTALDADDVTVRFERDLRGAVVAREDALGARWEYERDANGRVVREIDPEGTTTEYAYDGAGRLAEVLDARGRTTAFAYDEFGLVRRVDDDLGMLAARAYDAEGRLVESVDADGGVVSFGYDAGGQLTSVVDELGAETVYVYDGRGLLERIIDPDGRENVFTYDAAGRRATESDLLGRTTTFERDAAGRVLLMRDAEGRETRYDRDVLGRVSVITYDDGSEEQLAYDEASRVAERILPDGRIFRWTYDDRGWLVSEDAPEDELDATFTYYPDGQPESAENGWSRIEFEWDAADRLVARTENGRRTSFAYDIAAGQTTTTYPSGLEVLEKVDLRGRTSEVRLDGSAWSWRYDARNHPTRRTGPGLRSEYEWTARGELEHVRHASAFERVATRDASGRVVAERDARRPERSWRYDYDDAGRLVGAVRGEMDGSGGIPAPVETWAYTYDDVSNLLACEGPDGSLACTYDDLHRVQSMGDRTLVHDAAGNLVSDGTFDYAYDARGRLLRVTRTDGGEEVLAIGYNALGDRIVTRQDGVSIEHVRLGDRVLEDRAADGTVLRRYVYGASDRELLQLQVGEDRYHYLQDRIGNVVGLVDAGGHLVERYAYSPYGELARFDAAGAPLAASLVGNPFHFGAQRLDEPMGWYHFRFRSYAPDLQRFVSRDPAGYVAGGSLYVYALADPVNGIDEQGDFAFLLLAGAVGANVMMWGYNAQHACGNPLDPASYQGTDWNGTEQLHWGAAGAAGGVAGAYTFAGTAGFLSSMGVGSGLTYTSAGIVSGITGKAAEDAVLFRSSTAQEYLEAGLLGGVLGGAGHLLGKVFSSFRLLNAIDDINPQAAAALAEEVIQPLNRSTGFAGRVNKDWQILKNIFRKDSVGGTPTATALKGDIDIAVDRWMTQAMRVTEAAEMNLKAGAELVDAHVTHGLLTKLTPPGLVIDETLTAVTGKLQFKIIETMDLFRYGGRVIKPSTGEIKEVAARPVLELANPVPYLNAVFQPMGGGILDPP